MKGRTYAVAGRVSLDPDSCCVGYRVRMLNRVVSAIYDEALHPLNLKISQFGILAALGHLGESSAVELCQLMMLEKSTASRNLQRMRSNGWIHVRTSKRERSQSIRLTNTGLQILESAFPLWRKAQKEATRRLGIGGVKALDAVVSKMKE